MKFSLSLSYTDPSEVVDVAQAAERLGFYSITMGEHLMHPVNVGSEYTYPGPPSFDQNTPLLNLWATAGGILGSTKHLHFMSAVCVLPLYHPVVSANAASTLAGMSHNRFALGVGVGWLREEYDELGVPWTGRGKRFDEALDIIERAWNGVSEPYEGEHYSIKAMGTNPRPPAQIPLHFGGLAEAMMQRAADRGDGWICPPTPDLMLDQIRTINQMRRASGRENRPFEFSAIFKQPDASLIRELNSAGVKHFILSAPWRPEHANQTDPGEKIPALTNLAQQMRKIGADL